MIHHRPVQRRPVSVLLSIHLGRVVGVLKLHQTAGVVVTCAFDQSEWTAGEAFVSRVRKNACQVLVAQLEERRKLSVGADAACVDTTEIFHRPEQTVSATFVAPQRIIVWGRTPV